MQVSFIIPLFNCLALTRVCIESLQATLPADLGHEIILVDDGSTDGTRDWLASLASCPPFRVVLNERNLGYAAANNRGAALATGRFLVLLNNDLILQPRWLEPMFAAHRARPKTGIVGNVQRDARTGAVDHAGIVINLQGKPEHVRTLPPSLTRAFFSTRKVPAVTGACLSLERALWQQLGGFDEGFVNGGEDVDLCYKAHAMGRDTVVALRSVIRHHVSSSPGRKRRDEQNSHRLVRRWANEFIADATQGWSRDYLRRALVHPQSSEYGLACHTLFHASGATRQPPFAALAALRAAQQREFDRWDALASSPGNTR